MPYATQRDRTPFSAEISGDAWPAPPLNAFLTSGYKPGVWDLRWDNPAYLARNSSFVLYGVNIYRAFDSEFGPYQLITEDPLGTTFWRDRTDIELVVAEDVTDQFLIQGRASVGSDIERYVFRTQYPIIKAGTQGIFADSPLDVQVLIDGVPARVLRVMGQAGEVELDTRRYPNVNTQQLEPAILPTKSSRVTCTYRRLSSLIPTDLIQRTFYRFTTVAAPINPECPTEVGPLVETPLEYATLVSSMEIEKIDWLWREAVRRNSWILDQGGERVRLFIKKQVGITCPCVDTAGTHNQPVSDCALCFGTGIVGGYEGPYDITIGPDDAERKIAQRDIGRTVEHTYDVFTGPSPLISQRDFLVKINGERYSIGPVHMPSNRGMVLQQHFSIGHIDEKDIRYKVPMDNPSKRSILEVRRLSPEATAPPEITGKGNIPDERELRGRTGTWENNTY